MKPFEHECSVVELTRKNGLGPRGADSQMINKILIVGHPMSGHENVETLLRSRGMQPAMPSRREGVHPGELSATVLKTHRIPTLDPMGACAAIDQIDAGPIWHSLALDLLLGNIEQEFWGWSDPQSVYLLDYWESLDPQLAFILVYDTPQDLLARAFQDTGVLEGEALETVLDTWCAYNEALLSFFNNNPKRCLLVHAQQIRVNANACLQEVRMRIGAPVSMDVLPSDSMPLVEVAGDADAGLATSLSMDEAFCLQTPDQGHAVRAYIAQSMLEQFPAVAELYEELQAVANLPLEETDLPAQLVRAAWSSLQSLSAQHDRKVRQTEAVLQIQAGQIESLASQLDQTEKIAAEKQAEIEQLLAQLHRVQVDLELQYAEAEAEAAQFLGQLNNARQQAGLARQEIEELAAARDAQVGRAQELAAQLAQLDQSKTELGKALADEGARAERLSKEKADLQARHEELTAKAQALASIPELEQDNQLLLVNLHKVQEQLEEQIIEAQRHSTRASEQLEQARAQAKQAWQKAKKLSQARDEQGQLAAQRAEKIQKLQQDGAALHKALAETRGHFQQLELEKSNLQRQREELAARVAMLENPPLLGAATRVRRQLSYRLGTVMIERSRSLGGWLGMPAALFRERHMHKLEVRLRAEAPLPPIEEYADAHEAEQVRQHLAYRLGRTLIENSRTPIGWVTLPWAIRRTLLEYRRCRVPA